MVVTGLISVRLWYVPPPFQTAYCCLSWRPFRDTPNFLSLRPFDVERSLFSNATRYITRDTGGVKEFRFFRAFLLIIESAMIYSTALLIEIILYFSGNNAFYIVYDPIAQLTVSLVILHSLFGGLAIGPLKYRS